MDQIDPIELEAELNLILTEDVKVNKRGEPDLEAINKASRQTREILAVLQKYLERSE